MAYISQEEKKAVAAQLKKVIPQSWKYSLAVRDHSTLTLTIASAPVDLMALIRANGAHESVRTYAQLSNHWLIENFKGNAEIQALFEKILSALKGPAYFDNTDIQTDYFDVAHYIRVNIGKYDKPFETK
jgi:5-carboxymethyl-2-hydroxymuconate isomerase